MRKFLKIFLRSLGTYLGLSGGLSQPLVIVGFDRLVILITYGMKYITMEAVSKASIFARDGPSSTMCLLVASSTSHTCQSITPSLDHVPGTGTWSTYWR